MNTKATEYKSQLKQTLIHSRHDVETVVKVCPSELKMFAFRLDSCAYTERGKGEKLGKERSCRRDLTVSCDINAPAAKHHTHNKKVDY